MHIKIKRCVDIISKLEVALRLRYLIGAVIFVLMIFFYSVYCFSYEEALTEKARADLRVWAVALEMIAADYGGYPQFEDIQDLGNYVRECGYWLAPVINDPWMHPYQYKSNGTNYYLWSNGADPVGGTPDDIYIKNNSTGEGHV